MIFSIVPSLKFFIFFFLLFSSTLSYHPCRIGDTCIHDGTKSRGEAKLISECPYVIDELKKGIPPRGCGTDNVRQIVCCPHSPDSQEEPNTINDRLPDTTKRNERLALRKCREYAEYAYENVTMPVTFPGAPEEVERVSRCGFTVKSLVIGGKPAGPREFPHMALVGYRSNPVLWKCGGSIVSDKFILTAGHCLYYHEFGPATIVRVGELDYESNVDEAQPVDIKIKRHIPYTSYVTTSKYNDIALMELEQRIALNPYARPACLFTEYDAGIKKAIATGWGVKHLHGEPSSSLQKVTLELFTYEECNRTFQNNMDRKLRLGIVEETQMCAGSHTDEKDTCFGDSGGPLQIFNEDIFCMYNIIGITSFGILCGTVNRPAVYTRVSQYIDWIEKEVWPNE